MATHIADVELTEGAPLASPCGGGKALLALLRQRGRPVGLVRVQPVDGWVRAEQWQAALTAWAREPEARKVLAEASQTSGSQARGRGQPLSIVVCTHERPDDLRRCLAALRPATGEGHEIIVVDNAPLGPRTAEVVAQSGLPIRYLCEPIPGLDRARNRGLRAARHSVVAFTDDDAVPDPHWACALGREFAQPAITGVAGLVLPLELETPAQEQFETYCAHRRTFTRVVYVASTASLPARQLVPAAAGVVGLGANLAFRREWLVQLGGFDTRLDAGTLTCSGGDTDMCARVLAAGGHLVYTPEALVWHRHRSELAALEACIFGYGVGLTSFLTKRLIENQDAQATLVALRWLVGPFLRAACRRLAGQSTVPGRLLLLEAAGALVGPVRFWQERARQPVATADIHSGQLMNEEAA